MPRRDGDRVAARCALLRYPLAAPVGGSGVASFDLLTIDLDDGEAQGFGFSYVLGGGDDLPLRAATAMCERFLAEPLGHPEALWQRVDVSFNRTGGGPYRTALAALDVAAWDLFARRLGVPLGVAMGGAARRVPVYASGGYRPGADPAEAVARARTDVERGVRAIKMRAAGTAADEPLLRAVRDALGGSAGLMIDANEKCDLVGAARLVRLAAEVGALFVEEPLPARDVAGYRSLARMTTVPIAAGEHLRSVPSLLPFLETGALAVVQPDLQALGGLTPALHVARLAAHHGAAIAPHFLPGLFVHLACAAPNVAWLEEFPLVEALLDGLPAMRDDGTLEVRSAPGHGIALAPGAMTGADRL